MDTEPTLVSDLNALLEPITAELPALGHAVGRRVVNELLHHLGYTLQASRKSTGSTYHPTATLNSSTSTTRRRPWLFRSPIPQDPERRAEP